MQLYLGLAELRLRGHYIINFTFKVILRTLALTRRALHVARPLLHHIKSNPNMVTTVLPAEKGKIQLFFFNITVITRRKERSYM